VFRTPAPLANAITLASMRRPSHLPGGYFFWGELLRTPFGRSSVGPGLRRVEGRRTTEYIWTVL
jgi:hypothetical protein